MGSLGQAGFFQADTLCLTCCTVHDGKLCLVNPCHYCTQFGSPPTRKSRYAICWAFEAELGPPDSGGPRNAEKHTPKVASFSDLRSSDLSGTGSVMGQTDSTSEPPRRAKTTGAYFAAQPRSHSSCSCTKMYVHRPIARLPIQLTR